MCVCVCGAARSLHLTAFCNETTTNTVVLLDGEYAYSVKTSKRETVISEYSDKRYRSNCSIQGFVAAHWPRVASPLNHTQTFLHVCFVFPKYWEKWVFVNLMLAQETKQSGGKLLQPLGSPGGGSVSKGNIAQHTKRYENRYLEC